MTKPLLIIVNGLPASGKTTLAQRLGAELSLPVFSRDGIYETLYDALDCQNNDCPPLMGFASFRLFYTITGSLLAARQSVIVEGFFGRPVLRSAEFLELQRNYVFETFQILCRTNGTVLLERFLERMRSTQRHKGHQDLEWLEQNRERLLQGELSSLNIGGQLVEIDTTTSDSFDYTDLLRQIRSFS